MQAGQRTRQGNAKSQSTTEEATEDQDAASGADPPARVRNSRLTGNHSVASELTISPASAYQRLLLTVIRIEGF